MPETIDSLSINIASSSGSAVRNIDELTSSLKQLDFTTKNGLVAWLLFRVNLIRFKSV